MPVAIAPEMLFSAPVPRKIVANNLEVKRTFRWSAPRGSAAWCAGVPGHCSPSLRRADHHAQLPARRLPANSRCPDWRGLAVLKMPFAPRCWNRAFWRMASATKYPPHHEMRGNARSHQEHPTPHHSSVIISESKQGQRVRANRVLQQGSLIVKMRAVCGSFRQ